MPEPAGAINCYVCEICGASHVTRNAVSGTTPFMIRCKALVRDRSRGKRGLVPCKGMASSSFYRVPQGMTPIFEWYRPTDQELESMDDEIQDYVRRGCLLLRPIQRAVPAGQPWG